MLLSITNRSPNPSTCAHTGQRLNQDMGDLVLEQDRHDKRQRQTCPPEFVLHWE